MVRCVGLDFEPNGFYSLWTSYPIRVGVAVVDRGGVLHLYGSLISSAESLSSWATQTVPIKLEGLRGAPTLREVI